MTKPLQWCDSIAVRYAKVEDLPYIRHLGITVFSATFGHSVPPSELQVYLDEYYSHASIKREFENPAKELLVAIDANNVILGFALLTQDSSEPCVEHINDKIELQRIYVSSEYQGLGIGRLLFEEIEKVAKRKAFRYMWLGVWLENTKAQRVYRKRGYEVVGEHDFALGTVVQTDWIMGKML